MTRRWSRIGAIAFAAVAVAVIGGVFAVIPHIHHPTNGASGPASTETAGIGPDLLPYLPPNVFDYPASKQAQLIAEASSQAQAAATAGTKPQQTGAGTSTTVPGIVTLPTGLAEGTLDGIFAKDAFLGSGTLWQGPIGSTWYIVVAGGKPTFSTGLTAFTAELAVATLPYPTPRSQNVPKVLGYFSPPNPVHAQLKVTAASGSMVSVSPIDNDTSAYTFDVSTLAFQ